MSNIQILKKLFLSAMFYFLLPTLLSGQSEIPMSFPFELPQAHPQAYSLNVSAKNERLRVSIQKSSDSPDIPCYLLIHCRDLLLYFSAWDNARDLSLSSK